MTAKRRSRATQIGIALLIGLPLAAGAMAAEGRIVRDLVHSQAPEGNLAGDPADRHVSVYLPAGYDESPTIASGRMLRCAGRGHDTRAWDTEAERRRSIAGTVGNTGTCTSRTRSSAC